MSAKPRASSHKISGSVLQLGACNSQASMSDRWAGGSLA